MSSHGTIQSYNKEVKKNALDYVTPHKDKDVYNALKLAEKDYRGDQQGNLIRLAQEKGASQQEIADAIRCDISIVSKNYPVLRGGSR